MRKKLHLIIVIGLVILASCGNHNNNKEGGFDYLIQGTVNNGDSTLISLYIPSNGLDNRQTTRIINGKYQFKGTAKDYEPAYIRFENDIINPGNISCISLLFIENDIVILDFDIDTLDFGLCFKNKKFESGRTNLYFNDTIHRLSTKPIYTYSDPYLKDSMIKYEYPKLKKGIIDNYEKYFHNNEYHILSLYYLDVIVNDLREVFSSNFLTISEKEKLIRFYSDINPSLHNTQTYITLNSTLNQLIDNSEIKFKDFSLKNINDESITISEIIPKNENTVLYFWWSNCVPCRKFINANTSEYSRFKERGIEIISINTDESQKLWKEISNNDSISWINLHSGNNSEIAAFYEVTYFPRILIFDKEFNLVGENYKDLETLLKK